MKTLITTILFAISALTIQAQTKIKIPEAHRMNNNSTFGFVHDTITYTLKGKEKGGIFTFKSNYNKSISKFDIVQSTPDFLLAKTESDDYLFHDRKKNTIHLIKKSHELYTITSYGNDIENMSETSEAMLQRLEAGRTQLEVMNYVASLSSM